ncbi:hypothetical protein [Xanthomonas graminis]|uniref:hypothetical protein n=1 Tax=Xanthomonas graminis TaxID=3390026 RepID=UPI001F1E8044|nr:hypothetical protein [Xanthomonas translucens]UKE71645.1 hypothetical protein KFS85_11075 [Xanthomonas translucens pv. phleipratensis]
MSHLVSSSLQKASSRDEAFLRFPVKEPCHGSSTPHLPRRHCVRRRRPDVFAAAAIGTQLVFAGCGVMFVAIGVAWLLRAKRKKQERTPTE